MRSAKTNTDAFFMTILLSWVEVNRNEVVLDCTHTLDTFHAGTALITLGSTRAGR
jgi:hypothetical protein